MPPKNSSSRRSSKSPSIRRKKTYPKVSLYPNWKSDDETDDEELTIWEDITKEDREMKVEYEKNLERAKALKYANSSFPSDEFVQDIFPVLVPAMEDMLYKSRNKKVLLKKQRVYDGLDYLAELLWNRNPKYLPVRRKQYKRIYDVEKIKAFLAENPRPFYPLHWVLTPDQAATIIQAAWRGYWSRKNDGADELRWFWQMIKADPLQSCEEETIATESSCHWKITPDCNPMND